ncbi:ABC transporter ATP-binding protein [Clostridium sp. KNHs205]|uniref:ABC transporter ATP-binding protein n=1 Tax=Clostridium sp. KNHs205 TaxID=1449050 RepID=UPI00068C8279|nr:ABC transporter ATP-binding protein [Clostridium sp. KNHs205]
MDKKELVRNILRFAIEFKMPFINTFISMIVLNVSYMVFPLLFSVMVDEVFVYQNKNFYVMLIIANLAIYVFQMGIVLVQVLAVAYLSNRFLFDIRLKVFQKMQHIKAANYQSKLIGDLAAVINKDVDDIMTVINVNYFNIVINYVQIIACVIFVLLIHYKIAILMFVIVPVTTFIAVGFGRLVNGKTEAYRREYGKHISWVYEILSGIREIHMLNAAKEINRVFLQGRAGLIREKAQISWFELLSERVNSGICMLANLCIYVYGGYLVTQGDITLGNMMAILWFFALLKMSLTAAAQKSVAAQGNLVGVSNVALLLAEGEEEDGYRRNPLRLTEGTIQFENVGFSYNSEKEVLNDINLTVLRGQKIAIVGASGSGKTTMVNLLLRFYDSYSGKISIDSQDIREISLRSLRNSIGYVQQETLIFEESIRYNLRLGNKRATEQQMIGVLKEVNLWSVISMLPKGLDTVIGAEGFNLSGGQRQRLAIARILLKDPKILIFDEATSALDTSTEKEVLNAWNHLSKNRTTLIIAHRLTTILETDKVAVIKAGKLAGFDHNSVLLKNCDEYKRLFEKQYFSRENWQSYEIL